MVRKECSRQEMRTEDADFVVTWAERYSNRQKQRKGKKPSCPIFISPKQAVLNTPRGTKATEEQMTQRGMRSECSDPALLPLAMVLHRTGPTVLSH